MCFKSSAFKYLALALAMGVCVSACRTKSKSEAPAPTADHGSITVTITNTAGGKEITNGNLSYFNVSGNNYNVTMLKYFVSNFTLVKDDNTERNFGNYKLINGLDSSTWSFTLDSVANGSYKAVRFYLGVDSAHNHTLNQGGDLAASTGMIWSWSTGYIFFKHEGAFRNDTTVSTTTPLIYHYGTDVALATVDIPVSAFDVLGNERKLTLNFDLNTLYSTPNVINFVNNNSHQSTEATDRSWISTMRGNFPHAFSFVKVQ